MKTRHSRTSSERREFRRKRPLLQSKKLQRELEERIEKIEAEEREKIQLLQQWEDEGGR